MLVLIIEVGITEADDERCAVIAPVNGLHKGGWCCGVLVVQVEMTLTCSVPVIINTQFQTGLKKEVIAMGERVNDGALIVEAVPGMT